MIRLFKLPLITLLMAFAYSGLGHEPDLVTGKELAVGYPEHLTGAFTGGFGEETCRSCHFDYELNPESGSLSVQGIPEQLSADESLEIIITIEREDLGAAGFQLSARYQDSSQAGKFIIEKNSKITFTETKDDSLQYVQHTIEGTKPSQKNKQGWKVNWKPPKSSKDTIVFNIAANAANGDQSEFGDYIFTEEIKVF